jgi:hypothetical protein
VKKKVAGRRREEREEKKRKEKKRKVKKYEKFSNLKIFGEKNKRQFIKLKKYFCTRKK